MNDDEDDMREEKQKIYAIKAMCIILIETIYEPNL